ncbi:hypothetical protein cypCar_00025833 [Cyprinus carpio]|nr:hypothetical protein cypCar_00025833 [Cyprinus carpio]
MKEKSHTVGTFQVGEYVVFSFLFVVSSGIGIFFAIKERKKASSKEFLGGGRQMSCGPVALSLTTSFMSAVTLMPYFVMEILSAFPGLPGLFVACAFSGMLSTVAASINALATVMYEDFVSQCFRDLSNRAANWINKALCKYIQCVQPFQDIKRGYSHHHNIDSVI